MELARWIAGYERAWRSPGTRLLDGLFAANALYSPAPFEAPLEGRDAIAAFWESEREGPDERFSLTWEPVAIDGNVAVARVEVRYDGPPPRIYRDLWVISFDRDGRCAAFEEWPFFPAQPYVADGD